MFCSIIFLNMERANPVLLIYLVKCFQKQDSTGKLRSFHECYYFTNIPTKPTPIKRQWLSYSPTVDQIFCTTCKLFSLKKGKNRNLVDLPIGNI